MRNPRRLLSSTAIDDVAPVPPGHPASCWVCPAVFTATGGREAPEMGEGGGTGKQGVEDGVGGAAEERQGGGSIGFTPRELQSRGME